MKKFRYIILTICLFLPSLVYALEIDGLNSKNVIVYNIDNNKIIYEKNGDKEVPIASLTKIMTTIVSIEEIKDLKETVVITSEMLKGIPWDATVAGLKVNDKVTYEDLLYSSMIPSGADATQALAISLTGSIDNFVKLMNKKAKDLNLAHTNFVNTTGLDIDNHYSSVKDVLTLLNYSLKNPTFKKVYETKYYTTSNNIELKSTLSHYNEYLNYDLSFIKGSKTGYTDDAGLCLSTESLIDGANIITVTTGADYTYDGYYNNMKDIKKIYSALKENYTNQVVIEESNVLEKIKTKNAKEDIVIINSPKDIKVYTEKPFEKDKVKIEYDGIKEVSYKTKKGTKIGTIKVYYKNELIDEVDAITSEDLHFSLFKFIKNNILIILGAFIVVLIIKPKKKKKRKVVHR